MSKKRSKTYTRIVPNVKLHGRNEGRPKNREKIKTTIYGGQEEASRKRRSRGPHPVVKKINTTVHEVL